MFTRTRFTILTAFVALLALAIPALAESSVTVDEATYDGAGKAAVTGTATLDPVVEAQSVGGTNTNFARTEVADAAGINLVEGKIEPLANGSGLRFIWVVTGLPAQVPPEGVRYTWAVSIGSTVYQLQAKRTNLISVTTTEDPVGHVQQATKQADFFQLRGACQASYQGTPSSGCFHLAWLTGKFDAAAKHVYVDWPYNTKDAIGRLVAPDFKPGAVLNESQQAGMSISAGLQAAVSNTTSSDFINGWTPYFVGPRVDLAAGAASVADPSALTYSTPGVLSGTSYTAQVSGLTAAKPTVWVRACNGIDCVFTSRRVVL